MRIREEVVVTGQNQVELQTADIDAPVLAPNELLIDTEYTFISSGDGTRQLYWKGTESISEGCLV